MQSGNEHTAASCTDGGDSRYPPDAASQEACEDTGYAWRSARANCEDGDSASQTACTKTGNVYAGNARI